MRIAYLKSFHPIDKRDFWDFECAIFQKIEKALSSCFHLTFKLFEMSEKQEYVRVEEAREIATEIRAFSKEIKTAVLAAAFIAPLIMVLVALFSILMTKEVFANKF